MLLRGQGLIGPNFGYVSAIQCELKRRGIQGFGFGGCKARVPKPLFFHGLLACHLL